MATTEGSRSFYDLLPATYTGVNYAPLVTKGAYRNPILAPHIAGRERPTMGKCPFKDTRFGILINLSAKEDLLSVFPGVLDTTAYLHSLIDPKIVEENISWEDAEHLGNATLALPSYTVLAPHIRFDPRGEIPLDIVGVNQAGAGAMLAIESMKGIPVVTSEQIIEYAFSQRLVDGRGIEACPVSKGMMKKFLDSLLYGRGGNPTDSSLSHLIGDSKQAEFLQFVSLYTHFENLMGNTSLGLERLINIGIAKRMIGYPLLKDGFIEKGTKILTAINALFGEEVIPPSITDRQFELYFQIKKETFNLE